LHGVTRGSAYRRAQVNSQPTYERLAESICVPGSLVAVSLLRPAALANSYSALGGRRVIGAGSRITESFGVGAVRANGARSCATVESLSVGDVRPNGARSCATIESLSVGAVRERKITCGSESVREIATPFGALRVGCLWKHPDNVSTMLATISGRIFSPNGR